MYNIMVNKLTAEVRTPKSLSSYHTQSVALDTLLQSLVPISLKSRANLIQTWEL